MATIVVATYDIHRCYGRDGCFSHERIRTVLRELNTDIVALQEVETYDDGGLNLLDFLAGCEYQTIGGTNDAEAERTLRQCAAQPVTNKRELST